MDLAPTCLEAARASAAAGDDRPQHLGLLTSTEKPGTRNAVAARARAAARALATRVTRCAPFARASFFTCAIFVTAGRRGSWAQGSSAPSATATTARPKTSSWITAMGRRCGSSTSFRPAPGEELYVCAGAPHQVATWPASPPMPPRKAAPRPPGPIEHPPTRASPTTTITGTLSLLWPARPDAAASRQP